MGRRIGIMGGTFNPIHNGHLYIAKQAFSEYHLDEMWFIPTGQPPHKAIDDDVSRFNRLAMCRIATRGIENVRVNPIEVNSVDKSYSWLTLEKLTSSFPGDEFYFVIGEDSLDLFDTWVHPERICRYAKLLVAVRLDDDPDTTTSSPDFKVSKNHESAIEQKMREVEARYEGSEFLLLHTGNIEISSTQLREMVRDGRDISDLVPDGIPEYISEHHLYLPDEDFDIMKAEAHLKKVLKPHRYEHVMGVMYTSAALATRWGYSMVDARIAGLLHDCAKYMSGDELTHYARKHDIPISDAEKAAPQLLHAKVGADLARELYHVSDDAICQAIRYHTTGKPDMTLLEKIVFTADYIEPNRNQAPRLPEIRETAFNNLDLAVAMILEDTVHYLKNKDANLDETTTHTWEYYDKLVHDREDITAM